MFALVSLVFFMSFLCSIAVAHPTQRYQTCLIKGYKDNFDIFLKVVYKGLFFVSSCQNPCLQEAMLPPLVIIAVSNNVYSIPLMSSEFSFRFLDIFLYLSFHVFPRVLFVEVMATVVQPVVFFIGYVLIFFMVCLHFRRLSVPFKNSIFVSELIVVIHIQFM